MAPQNGYVPSSALVEVESGLFLETATAAAYKRAKAENPSLNIARPGGAYRSWQMQYDMKHGIPSVAYWNLNPNSLVGLANPGYSSHGLGICWDVIGGNSWMIANGPRLGFSRPFGDRDPNHWQYLYPTWAQAQPLSPTQRLVGAAGVRRRLEPTSQSAEAGEFLAGGTIGNFNGWIHGELVDDGRVKTDIWFRGISGNWFWAGGFTSQSTEGLEDLNPVVVPPINDDRTVLATLPVRVRSAAGTGASILGQYDAGSVQDFGYWTIGEKVTLNGVTSDIWYVTDDQKSFAWSGGFTTQSKDGLAEYVATVPPPTSPWPTAKYTFEPDFPEITTRIVPADWSNFENEWSVPNPVERKGFPAKPAKVVTHQWGNPGDYSLSSVLNTFLARHDNAGDRVSAHFVVNADEIVQMVALKDRAYGSGAGGNDFVQIEIDPFISEKDASGQLTARAQKIIANVRKVLSALRTRNDDFTLPNVLHKNVPGASTSCGTWIEPVLGLLDVTPAITYYDVTLNPANGQSVVSVEVESGDTVARPAAPQRTGFEFQDWYDADGNFALPFDFTAPITRDTNLIAVWEEVEDDEEPPTWWTNFWRKVIEFLTGLFGRN